MVWRTDSAIRTVWRTDSAINNFTVIKLSKLSRLKTSVTREDIRGLPEEVTANSRRLVTGDPDDLPTTRASTR